MSKIIFIIGGARSGKSRHAALLADKAKGRTVFIATAGALDDEMEERIRLHKISRPKSWGLIEEPMDPGGALVGLKKHYDVALIDCLGLWISNLLMEGVEDDAIEKKAIKFIGAIRKADADLVIVVSNEVGGGIVPGDPLSRRFRDLVGSANQMIAREADEVIIMQAGIPVKVK